MEAGTVNSVKNNTLVFCEGSRVNPIGEGELLLMVVILILGPGCVGCGDTMSV